MVLLMADDNQKSRNILENSNFLKHRCCLEDRAFLSNSIELVQRENFLALLDIRMSNLDKRMSNLTMHFYVTSSNFSAMRCIKNLKKHSEPY